MDCCLRPATLGLWMPSRSVAPVQSALDILDTSIKGFPCNCSGKAVSEAIALFKRPSKTRGKLPFLPILNVLCCEQVFGHHVTRWINGSKAGLCARCRQIESTTMASAVHPDRITEDGA